MAIAFDAATDGGNNGGSGNHTFAHTCSGSDRVLLVGFNGDGWSDTDDTTGVTYDGVAMTQLTSFHSGFGGRYQLLYILVNPSAGTHNVVVSIGSPQYIMAGAVSYTGCAQTGQPHALDTTVGGTGATGSQVTTSVDNCWTVLYEQSYPGTSAGTPPATERAHDAAFIAWYFFDSNGPISPAGFTTLVSTRTGSTQPTLHSMVALAPTGAVTEVASARASFF